MTMDEKILQRYEKTEPDDLPEPAPNCWFCNYCTEMFDKPITFYMGMHRIIDVCPNCHSEDIEECYDESLAEARREQYDLRGRY